MNCPDAPERLTLVEICERHPDAWVLLAEIDEEDRVIRSARVLDYDESMIAIMDRNGTLPGTMSPPLAQQTEVVRPGSALKDDERTAVPRRCQVNEPAADKENRDHSRPCYRVFIQERAVLSNAQSLMDLARLTREWACFDSRTIALHD